jgi:hypothetical protein
VQGIKKNALFTDGKMPMSFAASKQGFTVTNSEYLGNVTSSSEIGKFKIDTYPLQPLSQKSFPWLKQMAQAFERYEVEGIVYRFESLSGVAVSGSDSSLGTIAAYFHYDPNDAPAESKTEMLQYSSSVSAKSSQNLLIGAECDPTQQVTKLMYVDDAKVTSDKRFSSKGFFSIASEGIKAADQVLGELWIHYKIRFHIPRISPEALRGLAGYGEFIMSRSFESSEALKPFAGNAPVVPLARRGEIVTINTETVRADCLIVGEIYTVLFVTTADVTVMQVKDGFTEIHSFEEHTLGVERHFIAVGAVKENIAGPRIKVNTTANAGSVSVLAIYKGNYKDANSVDAFMSISAP